MFDNGLDFIRTDFHLHTRKDKEFKYSGEDNDFIKSYIKELKNSNISIGVITNHNKFDIDEYKALKKAGNKENILILPGVELNVKEGANGIHTLIVFDPDQWLKNGKDNISTFLTGAFATLKDKTNKCMYDLRETLEVLDKYNHDYFLVFAHVDQRSGLFNECENGLLDSLSNIPTFSKRVLGLQKSRNHDNQNNFEKYFHYLPAFVEGSDPKSLSDIGKGNGCYLKIGELSYSAVKFALQCYKERVVYDIPEIKHGYIESIEFIGGKFDGEKLHFSHELNCLIGIRGSGKSSIIEMIRYAFNFCAKTDKDYKDELVKNVLGPGGKINLIIIDEHGRKYIVSRIFNEEPKVYDSNNQKININPSKLIGGIQYFGQKDLAFSAENERVFLDKISGDAETDQSEISSIVSGMVTCITRILDVNKIPDEIEECNLKIEELIHKMSIYQEKGVDDKLRKQTEFEKDKDKLSSVLCKIDENIDYLNSIIFSCDNLTSPLNEYKTEYNLEIFEHARLLLDKIKEEYKVIEKSFSNVKDYRVQFENLISLLSSRISEMSEEFAEIKREINDDTLDIDGYVKMSSDLEKNKDILRDLEEKKDENGKVIESLRNKRNIRNAFLKKEFKKYQDEVDSINEKQTELKFSIQYKGDKDAFKESMKTYFKGTKISDAKYQKIAEIFTDYVDIVEDWLLNDGKKIRGIISANEYSSFDKKIHEEYAELLTYQVPNKIDIVYHDKLLRQHSIGQRASALILFILMQSDNNIIIIDQPEDDLDNKIIYEEIIKKIIQKKHSSQFIFATHNANIPVLGDSERVITTEYQDTKIELRQGNIDFKDSHDQIVNIMEGGKEAFAKRNSIYSCWK